MHNYITFSKFIPKWSYVAKMVQSKETPEEKRREKLLREQELNLNYIDIQYCLVGEAHHFKVTHCPKCKELSIVAQVMGKESVLQVLEDEQLFRKYKHKLFNHFKEVHPKELRVKK